MSFPCPLKREDVFWYVLRACGFDMQWPWMGWFQLRWFQPVQASTANLRCALWQGISGDEATNGQGQRSHCMLDSPGLCGRLFLRQHVMKEMLQWLMVWHEHKCIPSLWDTDPEYWWHQGRDDSSWYCSDSSCRVPVFWSREHMACPFNTFPTIQTGQDHSTNGSFLNGRRHLEENVENALLLQGCDLGCPWKDNPLLTEQRFNVTVTTGNSTEA